MKNIIKYLPLTITLFAFNAWAELAIIISPAAELDNISVEQLQRLYLNRADRFPGNTRLQPLDQRKGSAQREAFISKVLGKSEIELAQYWSQRMFSGKGRPPATVENDQAVIERVLREPGTLGYIDAGSVNDNVKVLRRIP